MANSSVKRELVNHARRHSSDAEEQSDFIQDAYLRIYDEDDGKSLGHYIAVGKREIHASWKRAYRERVDKKQAQFVHGYSRGKNLKHIYGNKYLSLDAEILDSWYYDTEHAEYDVRQDSSHTWRWHRIEVHYTLPKKTERNRK
jgi:hypothetical protein